MKLDQLASPEKWPLSTLFPHPSYSDGQTEKVHGQMNADATVKAFKRAPSVEMSTWYKGILISNLATRFQDSILRGSHAGPHDARWLYERKRLYGNPSAEVRYPAR
jgi:hypothetical protein